MNMNEERERISRIKQSFPGSVEFLTLDKLTEMSQERMGLVLFQDRLYADLTDVAISLADNLKRDLKPVDYVSTEIETASKEEIMEIIIPSLRVRLTRRLLGGVNNSTTISSLCNSVEAIKLCFKRLEPAVN